MSLLHFRQILTLPPSSETQRPIRVAASHAGQTTSTFDASIGISFERRPPCGFFWLRFMWRYTRLTPSTTSLPAEEPPSREGRTESTFARVPRELPVRTSTVSPDRINIRPPRSQG